MDVIDRIINDLKEFIDFFIIKYKYDQRGILKRYRLKSGLNKQLSEDIWFELFLRKAAYNCCAKFLIIKLWEDTGKISSKINTEGLVKWNQFVTNIGHNYCLLYKIAELDILESNEMKEAFRKTDYDIYEIDDELAEFIIEKLKEYSFKTFEYETICKIFSSMYLDDKKTGLNLQYFYKPANAIDFVLSIAKHKENYV